MMNINTAKLINKIYSWIQVSYQAASLLKQVNLDYKTSFGKWKQEKLLSSKSNNFALWQWYFKNIYFSKLDNTSFKNYQ